MSQTRSGLVAATITNLSNPSDVVDCMFNPQEYTLSKQNSWTEQPQIGSDTPKSNYKQGGAQSLQLNLHFDTHEAQSDVRKITDKLWKMMMIDPNKKQPASRKLEPPKVAFEWGRFYFEAVIKSMTQKFTLFLPDGTPTRCEVQMSLEQKDDADGAEAAPLMSESATEVTATEGDRPDNLAAKAGMDASKDTRKLMEENNIDNPLNMQNGATFNTKG